MCLMASLDRISIRVSFLFTEYLPNKIFNYHLSNHFEYFNNHNGHSRKLQEEHNKVIFYTLNMFPGQH